MSELARGRVVLAINPSDPKRKKRPCIVFVETSGQVGLVGGTTTESDERGYTFGLQAGSDDWSVAGVSDTTYFYPEYRNTIFAIPASDVKKVLGWVRARHMLAIRKYAEAKVAAVVNAAIKNLASTVNDPTPALPDPPPRDPSDP